MAKEDNEVGVIDEPTLNNAAPKEKKDRKTMLNKFGAAL